MTNLAYITKVFTAGAFLLFSAIPAAMAEQAAPATKPIPANFDWSPCKSEIEKWCKSAKDTEATYACLLKHDEDLSKTCDASHSAYEVATGRKK